MLSSRRRYLLAGLAALLVSGCGFAPVYGPDQSATKLANAIDVEVLEGRYAFAFRERLQDRFGRGGPSAPYLLRYQLVIEEEELVINSEEEITRYNLAGAVAYRILSRDTGAVLFRDRVTGLAAYSATAETFPTRVAQQDANIRLVESLAEQIVTRLAITSQDWME